MATPRIVLVHRTSEYTELLARHATHGQAAFFLAERGLPIAPLQERHEQLQRAYAHVLKTLPVQLRRTIVERNELPQFAFDDDDIVVVVGQDGLVANVARFLNRQNVIGVNPGVDDVTGVLCRHRPADTAAVVHNIVSEQPEVPGVTRVAAHLDDGQTLIALNEIYVGQATHQSARYVIHVGSSQERHVSSGLIVGTGTGATGWCQSLHRTTHANFPLPTPTSRQLSWFVREPWPSATSGVTLTGGILDAGGVGALGVGGLGAGAGELDAGKGGGSLGARGVDVGTLRLRCESETLVVFGDGIESDRLQMSWGQEVTIGVAPGRLHLV